MIPPALEQYSWILVPILIFFARILDVTIGTVKLVFIGRGYKKIVPALAFFEIMIWLIVITTVVQSLDKPLNFIAYAAGFATGSYVGLTIEELLAFGTVVVEVITRKDSVKLTEYLKSKGYAVTTSTGEGEGGPVSIIFTVVKRKKVPEVIYTIKEFHPNAFYTIQDIRYVSEATPPLEPARQRKMIDSIRNFRKSK